VQWTAASTAVEVDALVNLRRLPIAQSQRKGSDPKSRPPERYAISSPTGSNLHLGKFINIPSFTYSVGRNRKRMKSCMAYLEGNLRFRSGKFSRAKRTK